MAIKRITSEVRDLDASHAARFLKHLKPNYQRALSERHVAKMLGLMENGLFLVGCIALGNLDGVWYLVNGQHQLSALEQWAKGTIHVHFLRFEVDTLEDYLTLFGSFDSENRIRADADQIRVAALTGHIDVAAPQHVLKSFHVGKKFAASPEWDLIETSAPDSRQKSVEESLTGVFRSSLDFLIQLQDLVDHPNRTALLNRQPIVAGLIATHQVWPIPAVHFWRQAALGSCPPDVERPQDYPPKRLHDWLANAVISRIKGWAGMPEGRRAVIADEMLAAVIRTWNAWGRGDVLRTIKLFGRPRPVAPLDGAWRTDATLSESGLSGFGDAETAPDVTQ